MRLRKNYDRLHDALAAGALVGLLFATLSGTLAREAAASEPLTAVAPLAGGEAAAPDPVSDLIRVGLEHNAHGDLDAADGVWEKLRSQYPEDPAGSVFAIDTLHWRRSLDFMETRYDDAIRSNAELAIELCKKRLDEKPDDAQTHFYYGQALVALMRLEGILGHYYKAGKNGEEARVHLERALEVDPGFVDAKLPLGSYYYYASIATRYIRWLTWLWFVPTGEHDVGLAHVIDTSRNGDFAKFEAEVLLARFYLYMEDEPAKAGPILEGLLARYPENTYLQFERIEMKMLFHDYRGTIEAAHLLEATSTQRFGDDKRREMARIWRARAELASGRVQQATETITPLHAKVDDMDAWGQRWILLTWGHLADLDGNREEAIESYRKVIAAQSKWGSTRSVSAAEAGLEAPFRLINVAAAPTED